MVEESRKKCSRIVGCSNNGSWAVERVELPRSRIWPIVCTRGRWRGYFSGRNLTSVIKHWWAISGIEQLKRGSSTCFWGKFGNLSRVAGLKQTLPGMTGRSNFPNNSVPFAVYKTWEFQSDKLLIFTVQKSPKCDIQYICHTVRFLICMPCKKLQGGQIRKI